MDTIERDRLGFFRQRWAQENFRSRQSLSANNSDSPVDYHTPDPDFSSEPDSSPTALPQYRTLRRQKRSWRNNFRIPTAQRTITIQPVQHSSSPPQSSSFRSPMGSNEDTSYSEEAPPPSAASIPPVPGEYMESIAPSNARSHFHELYTLAWLIFFSLWGTLARIGVEVITQYPDAPVTSRVLWANLAGSFIMGFLTEDRNLFGVPVHLTSTLSKEGAGPVNEAEISSIHLKHKKTIPLYTGLATGFCGCFTSFSSFIADAFLALSNDLSSPHPRIPYRTYPTAPAKRNGGFSFLAMVAILVIHPAISLAALKVGRHFSLFIRPIMPRQIFPTNFTAKVLNPLAVLLGFGCWLIGALFLTIFTPVSGTPSIDWRARALIPLLLSPPGCILRYYLAKRFNRPNSPNFHWGTLLANVFGTLVFGMAFDLQHARALGARSGNGNVCAVLLGVQQGFCGCLTTVSTWVVELDGASRRGSWLYGLNSVILSLVGLIVIMGSMRWTVGFKNPVCG